MKKYASTGMSLPIEIMNWIDRQRGDIPRSKFVLRIIEKHYAEKDNAKKNKN